VDDPGVGLLGRETIYRDGERVGWLSSAGWGFTVCKNIGFGYVRNAKGVDDAMLASGSYELQVATERSKELEVKAQAHAPRPTAP
jgi:4-methylaminobutanoate oxidase (formaldehyde-forming)